MVLSLCAREWVRILRSLTLLGLACAWPSPGASLQRHQVKVCGCLGVTWAPSVRPASRGEKHLVILLCLRKAKGCAGPGGETGLAD